MLASRWSASAGKAPPSSNVYRQTFSLICTMRTVTRSNKPIEFSGSYRTYSSTIGSDCRTNGGIESSVLVEREYSDLNLKELYGDGQMPVQAPDWDDVFNNSKLPLMVDIGSGSGRFLIWLAKRFPYSRNYLGLEIRHKLVQRCQFWVKGLSLRNIHFISCNAAVSFETLVSSYPGPLEFVSILFPDPCFKKRHHKRRVLQKPLVDSILKNLTTGGQVLLQSDVLQVAMDMRNQLDLRADVLKHVDCSFPIDQNGWLQHNQFGVRTEREIHAKLEGANIYRRLYQKIY